MVNRSHFMLIFQWPRGGERIRESSGATSAVTALVRCRVLLPLTPLARQRDRAGAFLLKRKWPDRRLMRVALFWRRDRLTAIGRRRSDIAKKKKSYWGARRWRARTK